MKNGAVTKSRPFQSTPSVWRETVSAVVSVAMSDHFNPLPPCGGRPYGTLSEVSDVEFQSTPSVWRETLALAAIRMAIKNFNPLPPCGGRRFSGTVLLSLLSFQSTPSVWRETAASANHGKCLAISIHSLRVEGDPLVQLQSPSKAISIHSLRVEGDYRGVNLAAIKDNFNPLPPCGGRLLPLCVSGFCILISIHSLRVEGDMQRAGERKVRAAFQSTPSVWRETTSWTRPKNRWRFQSTPSVWRETQRATVQCLIVPISIHSLRVEGDMLQIGYYLQTTFQSTPSVWRETPSPAPSREIFGISIHSLRVEGDPLPICQTLQ